jgi:transcription-repair coupling factor (superfamily II helicase)
MGSSFELAVRDLEVRGAGNILGREQSGVIQEIGLEMYFKLLKDTLENLSKKDSEKTFCSFEPELKLEVEALIPAHYMPEERDRLYHYRQIAMAPSEQTLERILEEMKDLYGDPPSKVLTLLELRRTGLLARQLGVQKVSQTKHELVFEVHPDYQSAFGEACLERLSMDKDVRFSKEGWIFLRRYPDVSGITQARRMLELWISWTNHKEACVL